jgi:diguanylate cyclase (GGDEF)-like protein
VLYLDLDGFKRVNDEHGHEAGDRVLVATADRLAAVAPPGAVVARFGGDELTVLCDPAPSPAELERLAADVTRTVIAPVGPDGLLVGASVGVARTDTRRPDPDELLRRADRAMYAVKSRTGAHRVRARTRT